MHNDCGGTSLFVWIELNGANTRHVWGKSLRGTYISVGVHFAEIWRVLLLIYSLSYKKSTNNTIWYIRVFSKRTPANSELECLEYTSPHTVGRMTLLLQCAHSRLKKLRMFQRTWFSCLNSRLLRCDDMWSCRWIETLRRTYSAFM
jgi:hypothetical protein